MPIGVKVDEDLPVEVVDLLRNAGHDARTVVEEGLTGTPDGWVACLSRPAVGAGMYQMYAGNRLASRTLAQIQRPGAERKAGT